ncbi:MAG TPA: hypothetical protein VGK30_14990 [Candidatus Binatia bacterium]
MTTEHGPRPPFRTFHTVRIVRVPRAAAFVLAVPVLLALGVASVAAFAIAGAALFVGPLLAPLLRGRRVAPEHTPEEGTITLDPSAYRKVVEPASRLRGPGERGPAGER